MIPIPSTDTEHSIPFFQRTQLLVEMDDHIFQPVMPHPQANLEVDQSTTHDEISVQKPKERKTETETKILIYQKKKKKGPW